MIGILLSFMIFASLAAALSASSFQQLSGAVVSCGQEAVSLAITLAGAMAVWGGIMRIAERSGLSQKLTNLLKPLLRLIFRGLKKDSPALSAIAMNMAANLLGLGNAATPLGIDAMKKLEEEEAPKGAATLNMIKLAVMNACSLELIPATVAALRLDAGSDSPTVIIPAVIFVSLLSLIAALIATEIFERGSKK